MSLIKTFDQVTGEWLTDVLGQEVTDVELATSVSNWATNARILAKMGDGSERRLWLKLCTGDTFGRSEVDYYTRDYVDLENAPLVPCFDACHEPGVGYHILLQDLSEQYGDRKEATPTLAHGLALAEALARMHRHQWGKGTPPTEQDWQPSLAHIRPGVAALEAATGLSFAERFEAHVDLLIERWKHPIGLSLLHGDVNPTNVLTPKDAESPVLILDRQPFEWGIVYGLAIYDLAYAIVPWWPHDFRVEHQEAILRHWFKHLNRPEYSWEQAQQDWILSVEQCLHVPIEWCRDPSGVTDMRGLWEWQLKNITGI